MKIFFYKSFEDADLESRTFNNLPSGPWSPLYIIPSGGELEGYWLPYDSSLAPYSSLGGVVECPYSDLHVSGEAVLSENY